MLRKGHEAIRDLYCLAICHRRDIRSLRDLTALAAPAQHPRCGRILCAMCAAQPHELRVFVHYQPQFYHFHVHFTRLHSDLGRQVERAHLLQDIIDTLEADGNAYAKKLTLYYQLKANDKLRRSWSMTGRRSPPSRGRGQRRGLGGRRSKAQQRGNVPQAEAAASAQDEQQPRAQVSAACMSMAKHTA